MLRVSKSGAILDRAAQVIRTRRSIPPHSPDPPITVPGTESGSAHLFNSLLLQHIRHGASARSFQSVRRETKADQPSFRCVQCVRNTGESPISGISTSMSLGQPGASCPRRDHEQSVPLERCPEYSAYHTSPRRIRGGYRCLGEANSASDYPIHLLKPGFSGLAPECP